MSRHDIQKFDFRKKLGTRTDYHVFVTSFLSIINSDVCNSNPFELLSSSILVDLGESLVELLTGKLACIATLSIGGRNTL